MKQGKGKSKKVISTRTNIVVRLKNASPKKRLEILNETYRKNMAFLCDKIPQLSQVIAQLPNLYSVRTTKSFVEVYDTTTNLPLFEQPLDKQAQSLLDKDYPGWFDLTGFKIPFNPNNVVHQKILDDTADKLKNVFMSYKSAHNDICESVKKSKNGRQFSMPVVFLGILHGIHLDVFLNNTDTPCALFFEPNPHYFKLSCYFLDYQWLYEKFDGKLFLYAGKFESKQVISNFIHRFPVAARAWMRCLTSYLSDDTKNLLKYLQAIPKQQGEIFYPVDSEIKGLINGNINLNNKHKLLTAFPKVSQNCQMVIVASGPSLTNDLPWLKKNRKNLVVIAVISAVKVLKSSGIEPDFQITIDTVLPRHGTEILDLSKDKPLLVYYKTDPSYFSKSKEVFCMAFSSKVDQYHFLTSLPNAMPSSTCAAFSFAIHCKPKKIFLIGCDLGFYSEEKTHASNSIYDKKNINSGYNQKNLVCITPNFNNTQTLYSNSFFIQIKTVIEGIITNNCSSQVYNLSDGAKIYGAVPMHSNEIQLENYEAKDNDIIIIKSAFQPAEKELNYKDFPAKADTIFDQFKSTFAEKLQEPCYTWLDILKSMQNALSSAYSASITTTDRRGQLYTQNVLYIINMMIANLLFLKNEKVAIDCYRDAVKVIIDIVNEHVNWPIGMQSTPELESVEH